MFLTGIEVSILVVYIKNSYNSVEYTFEKHLKMLQNAMMTLLPHGNALGCIL